MSKPGNALRYLTGFSACDAARLTGLPIYCRPRLRDTYDEPVHPDAAEAAIRRGLWHGGDVVMDVTNRMSWADRWRLAWAMIGAYYYVDVGEQMLAA